MGAAARVRLDEEAYGPAAPSSACASAVAAAQQGWYVLAATILMVTQPFLTMLTQNSEGSYDYLAVSTTFIVELTKLGISAGMYTSLPIDQRTHALVRSRDVLLFAIPAFTYFVNNNLIFLILISVSTTTYQILSALKTVFTGILFRLILKRVLSEVQVNAILLLACGAAVSQFPICQCEADSVALSELVNVSSSASKEQAAAALAASPYIGAMLTLLACVFSAFAGVYSELLLKKDGQLHSIHLQNMMLYAWGVVFNASTLLIKDRDDIAQHGGLMQGYTPAVWLLIANNALIGLAISAILKFANNLVRVFAHTAAMMLTMVLEVMIGTSPFSPQVLVSVVIVGSSTFLYNRQPPPALAASASSKQRERIVCHDDAPSPRYADEPYEAELEPAADELDARDPFDEACRPGVELHSSDPFDEACRVSTSSTTSTRSTSDARPEASPAEVAAQEGGAVDEEAARSSLSRTRAP